MKRRKSSNATNLETPRGKLIRRAQIVILDMNNDELTHLIKSHEKCFRNYTYELPKDVLFLLTYQIKHPKDILAFLASGKQLYRFVCDEMFWKHLLGKIIQTLPSEIMGKKICDFSMKRFEELLNLYKTTYYHRMTWMSMYFFALWIQMLMDVVPDKSDLVNLSHVLAKYWIGYSYYIRTDVKNSQDKLFCPNLEAGNQRWATLRDHFAIPNRNLCLPLKYWRKQFYDHFINKYITTKSGKISFPQTEENKRILDVTRVGNFTNRFTVYEKMYHIYLRSPLKVLEPIRRFAVTTPGYMYPRRVDLLRYIYHKYDKPRDQRRPAFH